MLIARRSLHLGERQIWPPVVLAPMAGITNRAFRTLCAEHGSRSSSGSTLPGMIRSGVYVNEMITARGLVARDRTTLSMIAFTPREPLRSLQLYGTDAATIGAAVRLVLAEDLADHVDLNFGCPVPKVTRRGGGAALPYKQHLFARIITAAMAGADGRIPITIKMRIGIDDEHHTYLTAGRIAADLGVAWVALHARTAAQHYSGTADWSAIARLKEHLASTAVPVLGNGDIWEASDALAMVEVTGCDGVVVGRGCLGRPWLFANLAAAFHGEAEPGHPDLGQVCATLRRHFALMAADYGEFKAAQEIRKHIAWYLKGFAVGSATRTALGLVGSGGELDALLGGLDHSAPFPAATLGAPRGRSGAPRRVMLPHGWLDDALDGVAEPEDVGLTAQSGG
ncbi:MAG: tRNA dihydrouridine synthase DusB [Sporichthyaceae bacterium]